MNLTRTLAAAWIVALPLAAQSEDALRRFFEGRTVRVKIDMPGTKDGMDVYWRQDPPTNMKTYGVRMRQYGPSLRQGDSVAVTMLRVKGKNIEFQLGGGGYGVAGDDSGSVSTPSAVPISNREIELEKQIDREGDRDRRDRMKRDLARLRDDREREDRRRRDRARELEAIKKAEIAQLRMQAGSRINIWYPDRYLKESVPTPQELMQTLAEWVDFSPMMGGPSPRESAPPPRQQTYSPDPPPPPPPPTNGNYPPPGRVTRGMSIDQVHAILGAPRKAQEGRQGDLATLTETWDHADERIEVVYVGGVVVKYSTTSR